ncbi:MAG: hypothetical protein P4L46_12450 [Fimbriimonas sp.]|nr:hypothetical protein [Fimbriimonas sp.]
MKKLVGVLLACSISAIALCQKMDPFDFHVADIRLITDKRIQSEIRLAPAQITMMNALADENRRKLRAYQEQVAKAGRDPNRIPDTDPILQKTYLELKQQVLSHLSPAQLKRIRELTLQSVGLSGMLDAVVAKRVGLSEAQLKKAIQIYTKGSNASHQIELKVREEVIAPYKTIRPKTQQEAQALNDKIGALLRAAMAKRQPEIKKIALQTRKEFESVVSPSQLAAYKALGGKTFKPK